MLDNNADEVLETIILSGKFVVPEDSESYDNGIHQLLDKDLIKWSETHDDVLVLARPLTTL